MKSAELHVRMLPAFGGMTKPRIPKLEGVLYWEFGSGFGVRRLLKNRFSLRHLRLGHALAVQVDFADTFDPAQNVINGLAPDPDQF